MTALCAAQSASVMLIAGSSQRRLPRSRDGTVLLLPVNALKRCSLSCIQYRSDESSVSARKFSSLSRSTCSACLRCRNCPTWLPMTFTACSSRSSGSRTARLWKISTPKILSRVVSGKMKVPCMPSARATPFSTRLSLAMSLTQSGCPDSHTFPVNPLPGAYVMPRDSSMMRSSGAPGTPHAPAKRITPALSSTRKCRPHSQSCVSHTARNTASIPDATSSASPRQRVTVCSRRMNSSSRRWRVMSRVMPR